MRVMIHSNAPWVPTGYGQQTALLMPRLRAMGHEVIISAFYGLSGAPIKWKGYQILPAGQADYGVDMIAAHAGFAEADLVLSIMDVYKLYPAAQNLSAVRTAAWVPNDCRPLSKADTATLSRSQTVPIAMSRWGEQNLKDAGFGDVLYAPHAVDTSVFKPSEDRQTLREEIGIADRFVIGICAANRDATRKGFPEQMAAFSRFRKKNPDALLMLHTVANSPSGFNLLQMADDMGIADAVMTSDGYAQVAGLMTPEMMAAWYSSLDVLSNCSYAEGFGIPIIEAQACGTPVIVTDAASMTELMGSGWLVKGQPFWNPVHRAWWTRPNTDDIARAYQRALSAPQDLRERAREFALQYDADKVSQTYWEPVMKELESP